MSIDIGQGEVNGLNTGKFMVQVGEGNIRMALGIRNRKVGRTAIKVLNDETTRRDSGNRYIGKGLIGMLQIKSAEIVGSTERNDEALDIVQPGRNNVTCMSIRVSKHGGQGDVITKAGKLVIILQGVDRSDKVGGKMPGTFNILTGGQHVALYGCSHTVFKTAITNVVLRCKIICRIATQMKDIVNPVL